MIRIEIPPSHGWRVEFWWQLEQFNRWLYGKLTTRSGDPDMLEEHWYDCFGTYFSRRRNAAERRREA